MYITDFLHGAYGCPGGLLLFLFHNCPGLDFANSTATEPEYLGAECPRLRMTKSIQIFEELSLGTTIPGQHSRDIGEEFKILGGKLLGQA